MEKDICKRHLSRDVIGCIWISMSMFGSNQKLLMDKKHGSKRISGNNGIFETKVKKQLTCNCDHQCPINSQNEDSEGKFSELIKRLIAQKESEIENCKNLVDSSKEESFRKIVILKPEPTSLDVGSSSELDSTSYKTKSWRFESHFLFNGIKRLKSVVAKNPYNTKHSSVPDQDSMKRLSDIYIEAKKHLSEMFSEEDMEVDLPDKEVPRILGKILDLPEFFTPISSPRTTLAHDFVLDPNKHEETVSRDTEKEEEEFSSYIIQQETYVSENKQKQLLKKSQETFNEKHSPDSPPNSSEFQESSPVSVLEPLFTDEDLSPNSSKCSSGIPRLKSVEMRMQPLCIRFNVPDSPRQDKESGVKSTMNDKELTLAYIQAVIDSSDLNCEELLKRSFNSEQLLDQALMEDIDFYPTNLCNDKTLLFDCINEVLMEFCEHGPWFLPDMDNATEVVQEEVYWNILPLPSPHTLDQIVQKDLTSTRTWMDLSFDIGCINSETGERILDELLEEIITYLY